MAVRTALFIVTSKSYTHDQNLKNKTYASLRMCVRETERADIITTL